MIEKIKRGGYKWVILIACFLMVFIALGFGSSTKSTYLKAICDDLNLERSVFSINTSIQYIVSAVLNFLFGTIIYKIGARKMIAGGFLCYALAFLVQAYASELWHFSLSCVLQGAGSCWTTTSVVAFIVETWFRKNKGTIMGAVLAANGFGGAFSELIITPIAFDDSDFSIFGFANWRLASLITAVIFVICGTIIVTFIRNAPKNGNTDHLKPIKANEKVKLTPLLHKPYFYLGGISMFLIGGILQAVYSISKVHILDKEIPTEYVIAVFGVNSVLLALAKMLSGFIFDKLGIKFTFALCGICAVISIISLAFVTKQNPSISWIYCVVGAISFPLQTVMVPLFVSKIFDIDYYTRVLGYYLALVMLGYASGIPIINLCYDIFNSYDGAIIVFGAVIAAAVVLVFITMYLSERDRKRRFQ